MYFGKPESQTVAYICGVIFAKKFIRSNEYARGLWEN